MKKLLYIVYIEYLIKCGWTILHEIAVMEKKFARPREKMTYTLR